jgi:hypothetical protein
MSQPAVPHVRYCHGCGQYDDHPRAHHVANIDDPSQDKLYHYDCLPQEVVQSDASGEAVLAPILEARSSGKRGDDLREAAVEHAASIVEAPADTSEASA